MRIKYQVHVGGEGWYNPVTDGEIAGTIGECKQAECLRINEIGIEGLGIFGKAHVQNLGWSSGNIQGEDIGSTGLGLQIEAITLELTGDNAKDYNIFYRVHTQDIGFMQWSQNGEISGTVGGGKRIEAIQIYIEKKGENRYPVSDTLDKYLDLTPKTAPVSSESADSKRARIVAEAQKHVGYHEVNGYSKYGDKYGIPYDAWCAAFDMYVFDACGLGSLIPRTTYCPTAVEKFLKDEHAYFYRRGNYIPRNGDVIYFDYNYNGVPDHTGIVEGCDGKTVCTIEGNKGDAVKRQYYSINDRGIYGYGVPNY